MYEYTAEVPYEIEKIRIDAVPTDLIVQIEGDGGGGGGSLPAQSQTTTEAVKDKLSNLSASKKTEITKQIQEKTPYTSLNTVMTVEQLDTLTAKQFTKAELEKMVASPELLNELGVDIQKLSSKVNLETSKTSDFEDVSQDHWVKDSVDRLVKLGVITGVTNERFAPSSALKVSDTFTALDRVLLLNGINDMKLDRSTVEKYMTNTEHWAFANMASVASKLNESTLKEVVQVGEGQLTRGLLAQVLFEVTAGRLEKANEIVSFKDAQASAYSEALDYCKQTGLLIGMGNNEVAAEKELTRAELAVVLERLTTQLEARTK